LGTFKASFYGRTIKRTRGSCQRSWLYMAWKRNKATPAFSFWVRREEQHSAHTQ